MAEGYEEYHVPQQSRRDKLRVVLPTHTHSHTRTHPAPGGGCVDNLQGCAGLLPLYDPSSLISPDLLTCATLHHTITNNNHQTSSYQDLNNPPFFYAPQNLNNHNPYSYNIGATENQHNPTNTTTNTNTTSSTTQGLSLSLSSSVHNNYHHQTNSTYVVGGDEKVTGGYVGGAADLLSRNNDNNNMFPLGPFVGYGSILKESRFLKPAEQLLEGICDVGCGIYAEKITSSSSSDSPLIDLPAPLDILSTSGIVDDPRSSRDVGGEDRSKKSRLISMLDEVYRRYKQYYQQVQAVVASFETVPGLSNAAPYAHLALKAMSKHFGYLKNAITDQLQFTTKSHGQLITYGNDDTPRSVNPDKGFYGQRQIHNNLGFNEHQPPVWRPQRGLPERAVTVLRAWLFEHFLHPYPTDTDKLMLAKQTGLSRNQVSNWFINARVRLWKPMVEEIHTLETRESQKKLQKEEQNASRMNDHFPPSASPVAENTSTSTQIVQEFPLKRTRNVFLNNPSMGIEEPMNLMYNNSSRHQEDMGGVGTSAMGGNSGVSLTLGLHQNNGVVFSEPFPINAARRFGLDSSSQGFVMGSFEGQNRQFGRNYGGGHLLHDFVG